MKLVSGAVEYSEKPLAFISDGEILPCCCMPVGDIEIEF
jgi:ferredoxin